MHSPDAADALAYAFSTLTPRQPGLMFAGMPVTQSALATKTETRWVLRRNPTRKRRRNWRAERVEFQAPAIFRTPRGLIVHPDLWHQLVKLTRQHEPFNQI